MELTPEERQKIFAEEKARLEAQQTIQREQEQIKKNKQKQTNLAAGLGCFGFIMFMIMLGAIGSLMSSKDQVEPKELKLNGITKFTGTQFVITNTDAYDWDNVSLYIDNVIGGYKLTYHKIKSGETYSVGSAQFAKSDGTRYNPFTQKPKKLYIYADTPEGEGNCVFGWDD